MSLFSGMSADKSADKSADALCIIILHLILMEEWRSKFISFRLLPLQSNTQNITNFEFSSAKYFTIELPVLRQKKVAQYQLITKLLGARNI